MISRATPTFNNILAPLSQYHKNYDTRHVKHARYDTKIGYVFCTIVHYDIVHCLDTTTNEPL
jgi:hypothetical protein